jgi:hypothetical protein
MNDANDLSDIWAVLAPMFSCITHDADGWWAHVKAPQREWNGFDKPALSRQLSGLLRMPLCGSEKIYERPIQESSQGTSDPNDLEIRRDKDAERYRYLRRKFAIIYNGVGRAEFQALNLPLPTYCAPHPACELDAAIDEAIGGE